MPTAPGVGFVSGQGGGVRCHGDHSSGIKAVPRPVFCPCAAGLFSWPHLLGNKMMLDVLRHMGTVIYCSERLNMLVNTIQQI